MKRFNDQHIKDVLSGMMRNKKVRQSYYEFRLNKHWSELMSPAIAKMTESIKLNKRLLILQLSSATVRHEYAQNKKQLIKKLNDFLEEDYITDILLR